MAQGAASIFFCDRFRDLQNEYAQYLKALVLWNMVSAMMSVPNTRDVLVIPAACYSKLKDDLHVQLYQVLAANTLLFTNYNLFIVSPDVIPSDT